MKKNKILESTLPRINANQYSGENREILFKTGMIVSEPIPKNGHRLYFICKYCHTKRKFLYLLEAEKGKLFACRVCLKLAYESSQGKYKYYRAWKCLTDKDPSLLKYFRPGRYSHLKLLPYTREMNERQILLMESDSFKTVPTLINIMQWIEGE